MPDEDRLWPLLVAAIGQRIDSAPALALIEAIGAKPLRAMTPQNLYDHSSADALGISVFCTPTPKYRRYWPERKEKRAYLNYIHQIMLSPPYPGALPDGLHWGIERPALEAIARFEGRGSDQIPYWNFAAPAPDATLAATHSSRTVLPAGQAVIDRLWLELVKETDHISAYADHEQSKPLVYVEDAFFAVWCGLNGLLDETRFDPATLQVLHDRSVSPLGFLHGPCGRLLWSGDLRAEFAPFVALYHGGSGLPDAQRWVSDIKQVFGISNHFSDDPDAMTQDHWANYDRIAPQIAQRFAQWRSGELKAKVRTPR